MKEHNDIERIDELFRNNLENAEFDVPDAAWNAIESGINSQAHVAGQAGGALLKGAFFKGAALLVAAGIAVGSYFYLTNTDKSKNDPAKVIVQDNHAANSDDRNAENPATAENGSQDNAGDKTIEQITIPSHPSQTASQDKGTAKTDATAKDGNQNATDNTGKEANSNQTGNSQNQTASPEKENVSASFWFTLSDTVICLGDAVVVNTYQDMKASRWYIDGIQYFPGTAPFSLRFDRGGFFTISMENAEKKFSRTVFVESIDAAFRVTYLDKGRFRFSSSGRGGKTCEWDFGDGTAKRSGSTIEHTFPPNKNISNYRVVLTVKGKANCSDTFGMEVQNRFTGKQYGAPQVPDVFSPNGDGYNDKLEVTWDGDGPCVIVITDLKGFRVWESKDAVNQFWDGTYQDTAKPCPAGQYIATISYRDQDGKVKSFNVVLLLTL